MDPAVKKQYDIDTKYCLLCKKNETREECAWGPEMWDKYTTSKLDIGEGMTMKVFKQQRSRQKQKAKREAEKTSPTRRAGIHNPEKAPEREARRNAADGETGYGGRLRPNKVRKAKALGELGEEKDHEVAMAQSQLSSAAKDIKTLQKRLGKKEKNIPAWMQAKITDTEHNMDAAAGYTNKEEFVLEKKKGLWDNIHARREKGLPPKKPGEKGYPKTLNVEGVKSYNQFMTEVAAWQRKEGKNKEGGLNEKGRKSYERENPGSDLKAPSKKVGNPRRASFCARMQGMKAKLTSKKTASDPDSRINKSLRAWNC